MGPPVADGFQDYLFEYPHNGGTWSLKVKAASPEDARERLKSMAWARYRGEVAATVRVPGILESVVRRLLGLAPPSSLVWVGQVALAAVQGLLAFAMFVALLYLGLLYWWSL